MDEGFVPRIGTFFLLIGAVLFIIFLGYAISDKTAMTDEIAATGETAMAERNVEKTSFDYFFVALMAVVAGLIMRGKKARPPSSGRFSYSKKLREKKDEKTKKPEGKK